MTLAAIIYYVFNLSCLKTLWNILVVSIKYEYVYKNHSLTKKK